ncbi:RHS repeat-associated core domain-containing protein, partial [Paenibacillus elgii]
SMVPGLGIIAGAASAVVSICRGDFLGAALSIGSMLPIGGAAFGAAKLAAKGVAKVAAKAAAKAGGKMAGKIGRAAAKKAVQFGKNTLNKVMTGARKLKQKAEELRELLQKKLQDMQQKLAEKGKALLQKALEKSGAKKALTWINHKVLTKIPGTRGLKDKLCKWGCEPIDLITGRMMSATTDFEFPGLLPLRWDRRWISDSSHRGLLGHGVHHNLDMRLEVLNDCIGVLLADGRVAGFERLHRGVMEARNPKERMVLRRDGTGYALYEEESRLTYYFGKQTGMETKFRLERIGQEWGHSIALTYDGRGYLQQVTDSVGRRLEIQTDEAGRMTKVTHVYRGEQREVLMQYRYDEAGDLIAVTDAMGKTTYLSYDQHLLVKMTDRNGNTFHWHYDGPTTGARCIHTYGDDGLLEGRIAYHDGWNELTNSQGHTTTYVYTPEYYCTRMVDALGGVVHYEYSELGELLSVTDEEGRVTRYTYDESARIIEEVQPDGGVWKFTYREDGRLEQVTDPEGGSRVWQYDELGRMKEIVGADGTATFFAYDERHRMSQVRNPQGAVTKLDYDEQDNLIQITLPDGTSGKWTYNHRGECVQMTDPLGAKQVFVYDVLGRVVRAELPDGNVIKLQYNAYEDVILAEDNQHRVAFGYTPLGKLAWREERGKRIELVYNKEEELTEVINERGERYALGRDANGSIVRETGFDGIVRQYVRSPAGLLQKVERPGGRWTAYNLDVMGRVTEAEYSDGLVETFRYNRIGQLVETANPFATVKLDYDRTGRVIKEWRDAYWVASQYDDLGNRTEVSSCLGAHVTMERDILGQISQMQAQQQHGGVATQAGGMSWAAQMKYDALGQEIERLLPGGVISSWQYDIAGRPQRHSVNAGGRETRKRKYTWDVNNRLKSVLNELTGKKTQYGYDDFGTLIGATNDFGKIFRMADNVGNLYSDGHKTDRTYGAGGRLLEFNGTKYSYDEEGNLTEKIDPDGTHWCYEYYGNNMMSKVIRPDGQEVTFTYDSLGRRIEKHFNGVVHCYVWDGNTILHEWKAEKVQVESGAEWNEEQPKATQQLGQALNPDGLITWIFEDGTFHPAAKITPEGSFSIVTDHLGTPVEMYDDTGEKLWSCELDIYGNIRRQDLLGERSACPFRFPGQYEDEETGLYYNRFRYYSPHEGMYTQQDPIGLAGGFQLYGYVPDPNAWVDVFGLNKGDFCDPVKGMAEGVSEVTEGIAEKINWKGFDGARSPKNPALTKLQEHYQNHGPEFGDITQNQYLKMSKEFAKESNSAFKEAKVGNFVIKYDPATRRTLVGNVKSREIKTFYKADFRADDPFQAAIETAKETGGIK